MIDLSKLKSRKLALTLITAATIVANKQFNLGLDDNMVYALVASVMAYVIGQGLADGKNPERKEGE